MTELDALNGTEIVDSICSALKSMDPSQREELLEALRRMIEAESLGIAEASCAWHGANLGGESPLQAWQWNC